MKQVSRIVLAAGLAVCGVSALVVAQDAPPAGGKVVVKSAADLPVHEYVIEGKASEFLVSDEAFREFVGQVKANIASDLAKYDIQDKTTLQGYYTQLLQIALFENDDAVIPGLIARVRDLEGKESKRLMTGQIATAMLAARKQGGEEAVFREELQKNVSALPWEKIAEEVKLAKGRAQLISKDLILGQVKAALDPAVENAGGKLTGELVGGMVGMRVMLDKMLPLQPAVAEVYGGLIEANAARTAARVDVWTPNLVELSEKDKGTPVVVCVWDSGVDTGVFDAGALYTNGKEQSNGKDDDGNGYVDDVHGIAFDLRSHRTPVLLHPLDELQGDKATVTGHIKGMMDMQASIASPQAQALQGYLKSLNSDDVKAFIEDLGLFGLYSHGTHVAGIAQAGNPFARVLAVRLTFHFHEIPTITPTVEEARKAAQMYKDSVAYMKGAGVRVVNMSWGGGVKDIETELEKKGAGATPGERTKLAKEIFGIARDGLDEAIRSAPGILFIAASGNSDNDNEFAEFIPSGLSAPNLVTVGAIDITGKPTNFTTFGKNVKLYANGFEVESFIPGGARMKYSGTSMAAPHVANLAAKLIALNPGLSTSEVVTLMTQGADPMPGYEGRSIINPRKTVGMVRK